MGERGPLMLMPTTEDSDTDPMDMASAPLMQRLTTEDSDTAPTDTARGQLMLRLTTVDSATDPTAMASGQLTLTTDTADTAPTDTASKRFTTDGEAQPKLKIIAKRKSKSGTKTKLHPGTKSDPRTDMIREFCNLLHETKINICTS